MVLSDLVKGGLESGARVDEYIYQNKVRKKAKFKNRYNQVPQPTQDTTWESDKNTKRQNTWPLRKLSLLFFRSKNHVITHSVIAAILDVILNILQLWKPTTTCQSNSPNTTAAENYQKIIIDCNFDFGLNFALKWRPSWTPSEYLNPLNQTNAPLESFVLLSH